MVETAQALVTADQLFEMSFPDGRVDLVRGEVFYMSPTGGEHGLVAGEIHTALSIHVKAHNLGRVCAAETGFIIARNPDTVRGPDVAFISHERMGEIKRPKKYWPFAPDLAVEVMSPGDTAEEIEQKVREWFDGGARQVWVAYPTPRTIHVYHSPSAARILREGDTLSGNDVVPGFSCPVTDIFV